MLILAFNPEDAFNLLYLLAAVMFILGIKFLSKVPTAARGNLVSAGGMLLAAVVTLVKVIVDNYGVASTDGAPGDGNNVFVIALVVIFIAMAIGAVAGLLMAIKVPMTGMPQMVALLNGFGGIASLLVACGDYLNRLGLIPHTGPNTFVSIMSAERDGQSMPAAEFIHEYIFAWHSTLATGLATLIGGVTFTGSLIAFAKLQEIMSGKPILFTMQKIINGILLLVCVALCMALVMSPTTGSLLATIAVISLILGVLLVIPIGGADMPVVISLLNSYSGLAAAMAGFVLGNQALIITGSLVGASGLILTNIMCKAMNRSLANVLFAGVGAGPVGGKQEITGTARELSAEDVAIQLDAASKVIVVPGYGLAVAQAQHAVKELADRLEEKGIEVQYAIHPVAGRMPGHMNVLLAEANVPYEELIDLDQANGEFENCDVALVIGANDVTNPAARTQKDSPIYGMPILDVDKSRSVVVIKRSLSPGFAGIQNELYFMPNCGMLFGDGKAMVTALVQELKDL